MKSSRLGCRLLEVTLLLLLLFRISILEVMTLPENRDYIFYFVQCLKERNEIQQLSVVWIVKPRGHWNLRDKADVGYMMRADVLSSIT